MLRKFLKSLLPKSLLATVRLSRILRTDQGHGRSQKEGACVDANGKPIPWFTYPAIEYLSQLDLSKATVFEYGSGNSTLFWADRCARVISVESDPSWHEKMRDKMPANVEYHLFTDAESYAGSIQRYEESFDLIIIDGLSRGACAEAAAPHLAENGLIIFDNSDWYSKGTEHLRNHGLIQIDMAGFGPLTNFTWVTSLFLSRNFQQPIHSDRQPTWPIGGIQQDLSKVN